jgi:hypothetical protein
MQRKDPDVMITTVAAVIVAVVVCTRHIEITIVYRFVVVLQRSIE